MSVEDVSTLLTYLVSYCAPAALIINLVQFGANAIISAATGRGIRLNGK